MIENNILVMNKHTCILHFQKKSFSPLCSFKISPCLNKLKIYKPLLKLCHR